jgi:nucleoside-diphosphate-sugar epimerase
MRVFVTGANGRVGLRLVEALVARGDTVVGLSRGEAGAEALRQRGAEAVRGSLGDVDRVRSAAAGARRVLHLAGAIRGPGAETADRINREGMAQLLAALAGRTDLESVVFTSSVAVYGDRSSLWLTEDLPARPATRYGESKLAAEQLLQASGLPHRIVRLAAVYGPGFPFLQAERIAAGRGWLPGEGRNFVPTIHVDDAVAGLLAIADRGQDGGIYNLADPNPVSLQELYAEVHRCVGGKPMRFWSTWIPSWVQSRAADHNERIQARIGRRPLFTNDNIRLFTASSRVKVDRMEKELGFSWAWPEPLAGVRAVLGGG